MLRLVAYRRRQTATADAGEAPPPAPGELPQALLALLDSGSSGGGSSAPYPWCNLTSVQGTGAQLGLGGSQALGPCDRLFR